MTQTETNRTKRTAEPAPRRPAGPAYWLIAKNACGRMEVLTLDRDGEEEVLPVFSHEEEAALFLRLGGVDDGWRVYESRAGELVSVLYGPCAGVKEVALDPLPGMVAQRTLGLVSLLRRRFVERITGGWRHLGARGRTGSAPSPRSSCGSASRRRGRKPSRRQELDRAAHRDLGLEGEPAFGHTVGSLERTEGRLEMRREDPIYLHEREGRGEEPPLSDRWGTGVTPAEGSSASVHEEPKTS